MQRPYIWIVHIQVPSARIHDDVFTRSRQNRLIADDVFVIIALPEGLAGTRQQAIHADCRDGFEGPKNLSYSRGAACRALLGLGFLIGRYNHENPVHVVRHDHKCIQQD